MPLEHTGLRWRRSGGCCELARDDPPLVKTLSTADCSAIGTL